MHKIATKFYAAFWALANYSDPYRCNGVIMLNWAFNFFMLAIAAAILGFGGEAGEFMEIAKFLTIIFMILFIAAIIQSIFFKHKKPPL